LVSFDLSVKFLVQFTLPHFDFRGDRVAAVHLYLTGIWQVVVGESVGVFLYGKQ
jgi:hypothetical protein